MEFSEFYALKIKILNWKEYQLRPDRLNSSWFRFDHSFFENKKNFRDFSIEEIVCWLFILCTVSHNKGNKDDTLLEFDYFLENSKCSLDSLFSACIKLGNREIIEFEPIKPKYSSLQQCVEKTTEPDGNHMVSCGNPMVSPGNQAVSIQDITLHNKTEHNNTYEPQQAPNIYDSNTACVKNNTPVSSLFEETQKEQKIENEILESQQKDTPQPPSSSDTVRQKDNIIELEQVPLEPDSIPKTEKTVPEENSEEAPQDEANSEYMEWLAAKEANKKKKENKKKGVYNNTGRTKMTYNEKKQHSKENHTAHAQKNDSTPHRDKNLPISKRPDTTNFDKEKVEEVFAYLEDILDIQLERIPAYVTKIGLTLRQYSVDDCKKVIDFKAKDEWFMENFGLKPDILFGDKFSTYLNDAKIKGVKADFFKDIAPEKRNEALFEKYQQEEHPATKELPNWLEKSLYLALLAGIKDLKAVKGYCEFQGRSLIIEGFDMQGGKGNMVMFLPFREKFTFDEKGLQSLIKLVIENREKIVQAYPDINLQEYIAATYDLERYVKHTQKAFDEIYHVENWSGTLPDGMPDNKDTKRYLVEKYREAQNARLES